MPREAISRRTGSPAVRLSGRRGRAGSKARQQFGAFRIELLAGDHVTLPQRIEALEVGERVAGGVAEGPDPVTGAGFGRSPGPHRPKPFACACCSAATKYSAYFT